MPRIHIMRCGADSLERIALISQEATQAITLLIDGLLVRLDDALSPPETRQLHGWLVGIVGGSNPNMQECVR